jgi:hypothetical protein
MSCFAVHRGCWTEVPGFCFVGNWRQELRTLPWNAFEPRNACYVSWKAIYINALDRELRDSHVQLAHRRCFPNSASVVQRANSISVELSSGVKEATEWYVAEFKQNELRENNFPSVWFEVPVTVAERSKAYIVFARKPGSWVRIPHKAWIFGMCMCLFCVCLVLCLDGGLATGWSPAQGSYRVKKP